MTTGKGWTYIPNPSLAEEAKRSTAIRDILEADSEAAADSYRELVPVAEGDLRDSIYSRVVLTPEGYVGEVGATDWKAGLVEFGTSLHDPDGSLRLSVERLGYEIEEPTR